MAGGGGDGNRGGGSAFLGGGSTGGGFALLGGGGVSDVKGDMKDSKTLDTNSKTVGFKRDSASQPVDESNRSSLKKEDQKKSEKLLFKS